MLSIILRKFYTQTYTYLASFKDFKKEDIFDGWSKKEITWLFVCILLTGITSILTQAEAIIFIYSLLSIINLILVAKGKLLNYFIGIVSCFLYAIISLQNQVYGQFLLFILFFTPMQFYGWYIWSDPENMHTSSTVKARRLTLKQFLSILIIVAICASLYGYFILYKLFEQNIGLLADSVVGVVSVIAFLLMVRSYAEQWVLWLIIDILTIVIWLDGLVGKEITLALTPVVITRSLTLINAFYGYISWLKMNKMQTKEIKW
ncbi:nicotinamide riboside transporter PnuC [Allofrancisella frigidaquae]|uniref:Nicotinamide riboside transporter PnuC n=1 Tax=Allofrancisella frigidaquae TaxID=1085644 RepID=A0A6M3HUP2_9GAMM|nr:nicotinamide riboside transporter PnuC [Allofrancisella frigidaquae]KEI35522.1 ribosyl nicotinamide transporter [Francisella sp. W12-1067]QIV94750.1 nicotinamide riboside transporter PnuC [Allofrancisella frigidaquae]